MAGNVIELSDASFDETVNKATEPVLVDFWAPWSAGTSGRRGAGPARC